MMKSDELLDKMSAIADLAITCEAKVETFESRPHTETRVDEADKCKTIHAYAAKIALAALELFPPDELATVALALEKSILPVATMNEPVAEKVSKGMTMRQMLLLGDDVENAQAVLASLMEMLAERQVELKNN